MHDQKCTARCTTVFILIFFLLIQPVPLLFSRCRRCCDCSNMLVALTLARNHSCATNWWKTRDKNDVHRMWLDLWFHQYTWVSKWALFAYPSPKPTPGPKWTDRVNFGWGEAWMSSLFLVFLITAGQWTMSGQDDIQTFGFAGHFDRAPIL